MPDGSNIRRSVSHCWGALVAVVGGGFIGSLSRAAVGSALPSNPDTFPLPTLVINLSGSLLLGLYLARRQRADVTHLSLQFWAIGVLGSFTTFSAFGFETFQLIEANRADLAVGYIAASTLGRLLAAIVGGRLGRMMP
jgi:CrcB protein